MSGVGDELLRDVMNELVAEDYKKILLNLSEVSALDSSGVGELVASRRLSQKFGASLKVVQGGERVKNVMQLSQILPLFEVYPSEDKALEAFS